jgi:hypothetical protein
VTFRCPACAAPALEIGATLELPADADWDEITLQVVTCTGCGLRALAVYRESRHGALDSEMVEHAGWRVNAADFASVAAALERCPRPADADCRCAAHARFGGQRAGRWLGLAGSVAVADEFRMQIGPAD